MSPQLRRLLTLYWPNYFNWLTGLTLFAVVGMGLSVINQSWLLLPLFAGLILACSYFFAASRWMIERLHDNATIAQAVWALGDIAPLDDFVFIDNGLRNAAIAVSKRLLRGSVTVVDVYNPRSMPSRALARLRASAIEHSLLPLSDPRTIWRDGQIGLMPVADEVVPVVVINQALSQLVQLQDRERLLKTAHRVLKPGGRLIVVERVKKPVNRWLATLGDWSGRESAEYWHTLFQEANFSIQEEQAVNGMLICYRLDKPLAPPQQLQFRF